MENKKQWKESEQISILISSELLRQHDLLTLSKEKTQSLVLERKLHNRANSTRQHTSPAVFNTALTDDDQDHAEELDP